MGDTKGVILTGLLLMISSLTSSSYLRDKHICGKVTCDEPKNLKFTPGSKYWYEYEARVNSAFDVEKNNPSPLIIKAQFQLQLYTSCHGSLEVSRIDMTHSFKDSSDEATDYLDAFSTHSLSFYYEDGTFRELCPDKEEAVWVLNFKKGILSALQNTMSRLDLDDHSIETDINGECDTRYKLEAVNGTTLIITKQKNLLSCRYRHKLISILPTSNFVFETKYHKWSPMVSSLMCKQFVDSNIVTGIECDEQHSFLPFYNQSLGVTTSTSFKINLLEQDNEFESEVNYIRKIYSRTSLLYDMRRTLRATSGLQEISSMIVSLCRLNTEELQSEFSEVFNKLIHTARYLSYEDISQWYAQSASLCSSGRKHVLDGLPHLRSAASIIVMKDILLTEKLPQTTVSQFLFSMSLFNRPERETIQAVAPLVLDKDPDLPTYFTVSSLIHSYSQQVPSAGIDPTVRGIIQHWESLIQTNLFPENDMQMKVGVLKALGNTGLHSPSLINNLQRIIGRRDLPLEVRLAAVAAHRRMKCGVNQQFLLNLYCNQTHEEEVRIKAYLEVVKCPSLHDIEAIRDTLAQEQNNQVGSFVWSHLQNLRISALPSQMEIQAMLQNREFSNKFNKAFMKYSRNYESSFYINEYGIGGFVASNVIFSRKSYIPRSISSNITVSLFGETINLAEVTLEFEGFEQYLEILFWKNGLFSKFEKQMNFFRYLRSSQAAIRSKINSLPNVIAETFVTPKASLSIRIFGNEMQYSRVSGHEEIGNILNYLNPVLIVKEFLSGQEIKVEKGMLVCDARYVTPLAVGLPLFTDAVITSTVKLDMAGFINTTAFTVDGQFNLDAKLRPSIAINLVGSMGVDAYFKKTEVKVESKIYTSTAVAGTFKLKGYKFTWISLNLPLKKSELFSGKSQLVAWNGVEEVALSGFTDGRHETKLCSWPALDDAFGLMLCVRSVLPATSVVLSSPLVIFNGPLNIEVTLDKSDPSTQVYTLEYLMRELEDKTVLSVVFDTPGSAVKRGLNATVNLDKEGPDVTLELQTTRTQLKAQGFYKYTPKEVSLTFWLDMNGRKQVNLQIALFIKSSNHGLTYEPRLQFSINSKRIAELSGSYKWTEKNELSQCEVNMEFKTNKFNTAITGYVRTNDISLSTNLKFDYQFDNLTAEYVRLELTFSDRSTKHYAKLAGDVKLESSAYRQINTVTRLNYTRTFNHLDCKIDVKTNPSSVIDYKLMIKTEVQFHRMHNGSELDTLMEVKFDRDIDLKLAAKFQLAPTAFGLSSYLRYSEGKEITVFLDLSVPNRALLLIEGNFRVTIPNTSEAMRIRVHIQEKLALEYALELAGAWFSGHNLTVTGSYEDKSTFSAAVHVCKLLARSQLFKDIILNGRVHIGDRDYKSDLSIDYSDVKYALKLEHKASDPGVMLSNAEINVNTISYTLSNYVDLPHHRASMELHLDQYRDIHIKLTGPNSGDDLKAMIEIKWDANRDPSQKILFSVEAVKGTILNFEVTTSVEYPGRTIFGTVSLHHQDVEYTGQMKLDWGASSSVSASAYLVLDYHTSGTITFSSTVSTPFENWRSTHIKYGLWMMETSMRSNGSVCWDNNGLAVMDVAYDSLSKDNQVGFSINTLLNSTIEELSPLKGEMTYNQSPNHVSALLDVESSSEHRVRLEGKGYVRHQQTHSEYTAHIKVQTPFHNLSSGELSGHMNMCAHKGFQGGSVIALNDRNITLLFEGSLMTLNESKLMLTVYTPFQKYQKIRGLFVFSASKSHLIGELKTPGFTLGLKTIYIFNNLQDFDLQLNAVSGGTYASNLLLIGTLNNETVDFRGGWNNLLVGMTAKSRYRGWYDLEYRGSLFTPFEGFKENGAVAKFVCTDSFHFEVAAAVAKAKLGLKVVSTTLPEEEESVTTDDEYCRWAPEGQTSTLIWRGLFELNTLYMPTASGNLRLKRLDNYMYATSGKLRLNVIDVCLQDLFTLKTSLRMSNDLKIQSSHPLMSELTSKFDLNGVWPDDTALTLDFKITSKNNTYKFDMEGQYNYHPLSSVESEGIYNINYRLSTPFESLDHCFLDFNLRAEKYFFSSNITIDIVNNRIQMDGTLEVDDNVFGLTTDSIVAFPSFSLPFCHLSFTKDFSAIEKTIALVLKYPNKDGQPEKFEVNTLWNFGGEQYIKLEGSVITPFETMDHLEAEFRYLSEPSERDYNLEIFFKKSQSSELKLIVQFHREKVYLLVESSFEKFREIIMNGTLAHQRDGSLTLEGVISTDQSVRMDIQLKSSQRAPLDMTLTMYDNRRFQHEENSLLVTISVDLRRKRLPGCKGYDLITIVQHGDLSISFESDLTRKTTEENWNFVVTSNHEDYKEIGLNITVIPGKDQIYEISISGHSDTVPYTCDFSLVCNMWFDGKKGRLKADLATLPLSGDAYLEWEWDFLRNIQGLANASYKLQNISHNFSSHLFLRSPAASVEHIWDSLCIGSDISLDNKKWWFHTNVTVMAPAANDVSFMSFLVLPHNTRELHSLVGQLHCTQNYKYINQMLKYSAQLSKMGLQTSVQMRVSDRDVEGTVLLESGISGQHFLRDNFSATIDTNQCNINSLFTSSFTDGVIAMNMQYQKPNDVHEIRADVLSPGHAVMVKAAIDFESINNMQTHINCTAPMTQIGLAIEAVTNQELYSRYGCLIWPNNSALFNYTNVHLPVGSFGNTNNGRLLLDFPLATRHTITLTYNYQEADKNIFGTSGLLYNNDSILHGNFLREQQISDVEDNDSIKVHLTNLFMPIGLNYQHKRKKGAVPQLATEYTDSKRLELFKAEDTSFNIVGEMNVEKTEENNTVDLKFLHSNRMLHLRNVVCANNSFHTEAHVRLRPSVWASTTFHIYKKHTEKESSREVQIGLSYPRRNLTVSGSYQWTNKGLSCYLGLKPASQSAPLAFSLITDTGRRQAVLLLSHPALEKNVSLTLRMTCGDNILVNIDAELQYAMSARRNLLMSASLFNEVHGKMNNYKLFIMAKHEATRFHMDVDGVLEKKPGYLLVFKNFSYTRSVLPLQFWNSSFKLDKNNKEIEILRHSLRDYTYLRSKYAHHISKHMLEGEIIKGKTTNISGAGFVDLENVKASATVNLSTDGAERLLVEGDYRDNRHAFLNVWRNYDDISVNDISLCLKLNHSRLLSSTNYWRTAIKQDFIDGFHTGCAYVWNYVAETADFWTDFMKTEVSDTMNEIWFDAEVVLQDFIDDVTNVDMLKSDIVYFQTVFNESYEANEFYMQDIYNITLLLAEEIAFRDKMGDLPKIFGELWQVMGDTGESVRQSILYLIETVRNLYMKAVAVCSELLEGNTLEYISLLIGKVSLKYDKMIKDLHVTFINYVETLWTQIGVTLTESWNKMMRVMEPAFIEFIHYVDSVFWDCSQKLLEFLYHKQTMILSSANLSKDSNFTKDLDKLFKDISKNGIMTSVKKYSTMVFGIIKDKYFNSVPFGYELTEITAELYGEVKELYKLPAVNFTIETSLALYEKAIWMYDYFDIGDKIQQAVPYIYSTFVDFSHTALQNEILNQHRKTNFVFEPRRGQLYLEQQLPMPWHAFNQVPNFEEIREYKLITDAQKWLTPSNITFWSYFYKYSPLVDIHNWLPPYKGEAILGRNHHFVTFDKQHFSLRSPCSYLLARDFVRGDFTLVLAYTEGKHVINLFIGTNVIEIDLYSDTVTIGGEHSQVPTELNGTLVLHEFEIITVENSMGIRIECNTKFDTCTVKLSGWYFGKTAGLLGTMDNEPYTDWMMPNGAVATDLSQFTSSWVVDSEMKCTSHIKPQKKQFNPTQENTCNGFFASKASQFTSCFPIVDPQPYLELCHRSLSDVDNDICTSAVMYIQQCLVHNVPLRPPHICTSCQLYSTAKKQMLDGEVITIKGNRVPQSSDVVFILEAKECNNFSLRRKNMPTIVNAIAKELQDAAITNSRFAVVVFGGDGVFNEPRILLTNSQEDFSSNKQIVTNVFTHIPIGNGKSDILNAVKYAMKMKYRPAVSKTFIVIPCSQCEENSTSVDYSVLNDVLIEKDFTLHILMDGDFGLKKAKSNRVLFGVDGNTGYTKSDTKGLSGDKNLWRQVKSSNNLLGHCKSIAIMSNGSIFTGNKMDMPAKKFVTVFAKRVAASATPSDCQNCECSVDENGIDTINCVLCQYPTPEFDDFEMKDNSTLYTSTEDDFSYTENDNL